MIELGERMGGRLQGRFGRRGAPLPAPKASGLEAEAGYPGVLPTLDVEEDPACVRQGRGDSVGRVREDDVGVGDGRQDAPLPRTGR
jgi:hypothetical protein